MRDLQLCAMLKGMSQGSQSSQHRTLVLTLQILSPWWQPPCIIWACTCAFSWGVLVPSLG